MLGWCFVWLKARFLLAQVALGWLGPETRPSSLPLPAEGGRLGLAVRDEARLDNAFSLRSPVCGSSGKPWGSGPLSSPCGLSEDTLPSCPGGVASGAEAGVQRRGGQRPGPNASPGMEQQGDPRQAARLNSASQFC